ncbi:MAG TPA: MotA/TolQ/ExbB proton channel family protein [Gimesia maris]|uniref:MotA/TolQ/ExbB proton channel family protein n=1 Tax=Gimesia maris TaxID=122 RepID=A0A3D3R0W0_9PLAN|nr:MotA/TolQ/ExbB proton channel family protein [Gimesia maris]|tara:strand:- start:61841 stop:62509 length:669 start_codon:yes stop_codon:yes gene_type:complete
MNILIEILYTLSSALLIPVILLLLGFVIWSLMELGGFLREAIQRARCQPVYETARTDLTRLYKSQADLTGSEFFNQCHYPGLISLFASRSRLLLHTPVQLAKLVSELEIEAAGRLSRINLGVRAAPILGLMGTLIPMGPALKGLTDGNIEALSQNLVVAFSTTVLGLFVGGICYTMQMFRRQWYARDLNEIEYIYDLLQSGSSNSSNNSSFKRVPEHVTETY